MYTYKQTSANAANVVALQAKIADARAELNMHKQHNDKRVNDLKHALTLAEDAKNITKTSLERSQRKLKAREQEWAATEALLNAATNHARVDAAKLKDRLQLMKDENLKQLDKLEQEKHEVDETAKRKDIVLETIKKKFELQFKAKNTKIKVEKQNLNTTKAELSRAIQNLKERINTLNQTQNEIDTVRGDIEEDRKAKKVLTEKVDSLAVKLAAEEATNEQLQNTVDNLEDDVAFKRNSSEHFRSAEHSFRVIRKKVNQTMITLMKEREQALLVSQDLLKVVQFVCFDFLSLLLFFPVETRNVFCYLNSAGESKIEGHPYEKHDGHL